MQTSNDPVLAEAAGGVFQGLFGDLLTIARVVLFVGVLLGVAGASFAAALPLASRWYPPQYQGLAMGIAGCMIQTLVRNRLLVFAARRLMEAVHDYSRAEGIGGAALNASTFGLPLYESLGYRPAPSPMMFLALD